MDSLPPAAHRVAAPFGRPKRATPRFVNPLRGFSSQPLPTNKKTAWRRFFMVLVEVVGIEPRRARHRQKNPIAESARRMRR
jgi:hypothetical protein